MQTQISKLGRSRPQSKGLHYFKSAEVCWRKHFQKSAHIVDIKSLLISRSKGLRFERPYKSPFIACAYSHLLFRVPCESPHIPCTSKVLLRTLAPRGSLLYTNRTLNCRMCGSVPNARNTISYES